MYFFFNRPYFTLLLILQIIFEFGARRTLLLNKVSQFDSEMFGGGPEKLNGIAFIEVLLHTYHDYHTVIPLTFVLLLHFLMDFRCQTNTQNRKKGQKDLLEVVK